MCAFKIASRSFLLNCNGESFQTWGVEKKKIYIYIKNGKNRLNWYLFLTIVTESFRIFRKMVQVTYHVTSQHNITLNNVKDDEFFMCAFKMKLLLVVFNWNRMESHSKREVLKIFKKMRKIVLLDTFSSLLSLNHLGFSDEWFRWHITWLHNTILYLNMLRTMSSLCVQNFDSVPSSMPKL